MSTFVDFRRKWTYDHVMSLRRVATPADLGAVVRESRLAARLTQAKLAAAAGVSREWLLGLERGARPRAELGKVLAVLDALDLPLTIGSEPSTSEASAEPDDSAEPEARLSTAEVTRRAIAASRPTGSTYSHLLANALPTADLSTLMPRIDASSSVPKLSTSTLMPTMDPSVMAALRQSVMPTAGSLARALLAAPAAEREGASRGGDDTNADAEGEVLHVDDEAGRDGGPE